MLRLTVWMTVLFAAGLLLTSRLTPARAELAPFVRGDACAHPCLFGIMPGYSRFSEVVNQLEQHPWVDNLWHIPGMEIDSGDLFWEWSDAASPLIETRMSGGLWFRGGIVQSVSIQTTIPYADLLLLLGTPDITVYSPNQTMNFQRANFENFRWTASTRFACPLTPPRFWGAPVRLTLHHEDLMPTASFSRPVDWQRC